MNLKKLLIVFCFFLAAPYAFGQSMTDDQVVQFIMSQQEKGESQQSIVSKLLQKGVTVDQIRRIKKKYEAQQTQPGAVDLTGSTMTKQTVNRMRTNKEKALDKLRQDRGYMIQSQAELNEKPTRKMQAAQMNDEISFLDIDSLIYYQNYFKKDNGREVFGRNIFNNEMINFETSMNIPTPSNYRLGAGDVIIIDIWGATQQTIDDTLSPDGTITVEGVGPLYLAGMTVSEANSYVRQKLGKFFADSKISLTVGDMRSIQVQVMGEVAVPGTYTLNALSTVFNALYAAGGISDIGTLRSIKVYRNGKKITEVDVYDYILNGNLSGNVRLADNDIIVVGTYDCLVNIRGKVKRPMFYEMKKNESVATILNYAGGFTGDAYQDNIRLIRKSGREYSIYNISEFDRNGFQLHDGDSLYVDSVIPRFSNMVEIKGAVFHPGMYQMDGKVKTVRELVNIAGGVTEDAFMSRGVMHREKSDLSLEVLPVDIAGLLNGEVADIPLRKNDVLYIPSKNDMKPEQTIKVSGEVNYPGIYMYADNTTLEDIVIQAGGLTDAASMVKVDVYRRIKDPQATSHQENITETFSFGLKDGFVVDGTPGFVLKPFDEVNVRKSPVYTAQKNVSIEGAVNFEGEYAMSNESFRLSDLVKAAGGLSSYAYAKGARLLRKMTEEELNQREITLRSSQIQMYEESLRSSDKTIDMEHADSLMNLKLDLGETYHVAVNLEEAMKNPGGVEDVVMREGDLLSVPKYSSTVKISGEVMYPISVNYKKGKSLKYYIKHAGGYGNRARKSRVYAIYMNGSVKLLNHSSSKDIEPGCEIVVPTKENKARMTTPEVLSIGTSMASIATMIATLTNLFK